MANITLGWNNRTDSGTLSGGSWLATLPLTNLQNRQVQRVARSSSAAVASTQFQIDLGQARSIGVAALVVHNISVSGLVRIKAASVASTLTTNAITSPTDLTNAAWTNLNVTVANNLATAPNGTNTATKLTAATAGPFIFQNVSSTATTAQFTWHVKQGSGATEANRFAVRNVSVGPTTLLDFTINYSTGAVTYITGSSGVTVTADAGGWWRVTVTLSSGWTSGQVLRLLLCFTSQDTPVGSYALLWMPTANFGDAYLYDSGFQTVWPAGQIPQALLDWEEDNFWLGTLSANARAGYQSPYIAILPSATTARYWSFEIADTTNSDGYVQVGRLFMSSAWVPSVNYAYGAGLGYQDPTPIDVSLSGAEYFDVRSKFRVFEFELQYILGSEAYSNALELQRLSGTSGEVLVVPDKDDTANVPVRSFVGRLLQIGPVFQPQPSAYTVKMQIKELL